MDFTALLKANRSYRGFLKTPRLTLQQLQDLVALTRLCPSSGNLQPLKYLISCDDETNALIQPLTRWAGRMKEPKLPKSGYEPTSFILIMNDLDIAPNANAFTKDVGVAAHTLLLGATEMGFGGIMLGGFQGVELAKVLDLPQHLQPMLLVALGKPGETVELQDAPPGFVDRDHGYYRDEQDVHHVWKRTLEEILVVKK